MDTLHKKFVLYLSPKDPYKHIQTYICAGMCMHNCPKNMQLSGVRGTSEEK